MTPVSRRHLVHDELGQTFAEYALLVGGIAIVVAVFVPLIGTTVSGFFSSVAQAFGG